MEVKIGKYIICKNAKTTLEIYKITGVGFDNGIVSAEPMIEIELVKEVPIKTKQVTLELEDFPSLPSGSWQVLRS